MNPTHDGKPIASSFVAVTLIIAILTFTYLVIAAVYFSNLAIGIPPNLAESSGLFWSSIILAGIFMGLLLYALIHIFYYRIYLEERQSQWFI